MKIVYIDGYWLDDKSTFRDYKCVVGSHNVVEEGDEDQSIFYYFGSQREFNGMLKKNSAGRKDTEFVITAFRSKPSWA